MKPLELFGQSLMRNMRGRMSSSGVKIPILRKDRVDHEASLALSNWTLSAAARLRLRFP